MSVIREKHGQRLLECEADGPRLSSERDAIDLIAQAFECRADVVVIPAERFDGGFFQLGNRMAGLFLQKFVTYQLHIAIVGDISAHVAASSALRDFVRECNKGRQLWFVADSNELDARLERGPDRTV